MPLSPASIVSSLEASKAAGVFPFLGVPYSQMVVGIANGVFQWGISNPANLALTGIATGSAGSGVITPGTSKIILAPNPLLIQTSLSASGFNGPLAPSLAISISVGIASAFTSSAAYSGVSPTVGSGVDVSQITVANSATLSLSLFSALTSALGTGPLIAPLSKGLSEGLSQMLLTATGTGAVGGVPTPPPTPSTGPTNSVVI